MTHPAEIEVNICINNVQGATACTLTWEQAIALLHPDITEKIYRRMGLYAQERNTDPRG